MEAVMSPLDGDARKSSTWGDAAATTISVGKRLEMSLPKRSFSGWADARLPTSMLQAMPSTDSAVMYNRFDFLFSIDFNMLISSDVGIHSGCEGTFALQRFGVSKTEPKTSEIF
jgi:hypothetical protein